MAWESVDKHWYRRTIYWDLSFSGVFFRYRSNTMADFTLSGTWLRHGKEWQTSHWVQRRLSHPAGSSRESTHGEFTKTKLFQNVVSRKYIYLSEVVISQFFLQRNKQKSGKIWKQLFFFLNTFNLIILNMCRNNWPNTQLKSQWQNI